MFVVLKQRPRGEGPETFGPIEAPDPAAAIDALASGRTHRYLATGRGRYHAVELRSWRAGTYDWTKARGLERVE